MATLKSPRNVRKKKKWALAFSLKINKTPIYGVERAKSDVRIRHRLDLFLIALSYQAFVKHPQVSSKFEEGYPTHDVDGRPLLRLLCRDKFFNQMNIQPSLLRRRLLIAKSSSRVFHLAMSTCYDLSITSKKPKILLSYKANKQLLMDQAHTYKANT